MKDQPVLDIQLLGAFCLKYNNQEIRQGMTARVEALLAYLLIHRETPIPRQRLAFLFWPETSEKQAHTNLRNLVYKLRSVLPEADSYIYVGQSMLQWQPSLPFNVDVDRFVYLTDKATSIQDLQDAVQSYAGDFMPDCYEDWAYAFRETLRQTYLNTLEKLLLLLADENRPREALQYAQLLLRREPTREETYCHLMRLYAQCGDRASVARVYKTCITVLEYELGVKPGTPTEEAYQKYISQDITWYPSETANILPIENGTHNLPAPLTRLIGRDQEMIQVKDLLSRNRQLTMTGPGGVGKTRLALAAVKELVSRYRDGIFFVDLAPVTDSKTVTTAIADGLQASDAVRTSGLEGLKDYLSDQNILLLLDNCEHVAAEVGSICLELLPACPQLTILITSREALKIYGETLWPVPALPVPSMIEKMEHANKQAQVRELRVNESVELFIERATSVLPTFRTSDELLLSIAEICRRLEGMPLAIEMAAARVKTLSVQQILQRLDRATELLQHPVSDSRHRHHTMEAVMDWSYSLLSLAERKLFARLGVFSGSFSLQAAEEICQGHGIRKEEILNLLASLVDKSLVGTLPSFPEARFRLHEIIRQYARQKLNASAPYAYWDDRHLDYFVRLAEAAEPTLRGSGQLEWFNRLELELENLRGALMYAFEGSDSAEQSRNIEAAAGMVGALWLFWFIRGRFSEGHHWAEQVLAALENKERNSEVFGKVLNTAASFCYFQGDYSLAQELSQRSLVVCKASSDLFGESISHHHLGLIADVRGDAVLAGKELNQGLQLAIRLDDPWLISLLQNDLSWLAYSEGNQTSRLEWQKKSLETARKAEDKFGILYGLLNITQSVLERGDLRQAAILAEESLLLAQEIGEKRGISFALRNLGLIAMQERAHQRADELLKQSLQIIWGTRDRDSIINCLVNLAENAACVEKFELAARLLAACEAAKEAYLEGYRFSNQSTYSRLVEMLPSQLDEGALTAAWTLGRLMSLEQAVAYALKDHS